MNLADIELTNDQKNVLCRGLGYGVPPRPVKEDIEAEFELCWHQLENVTTSDEWRKQCRRATANLAESYAGTKVDLTSYPLTKEELISMCELKKNKDLVITRPDRGGNRVVVLNKSDYVDKMSTVLEDEEKFQ